LGHFLVGSNSRTHFPMCHPPIGILPHQIPFRLHLLPALLKISLFFALCLFPSVVSFAWRNLLEPSKLVIVRSKAFWESIANSSFSIWRTLKNLSQQSWTSCAVLSFNSLNLKPFSALVRESSSLILSIEQTRSITYFFLESLSMRTAVTKLWTQTFNAWMGIIFTKSSLSFLMKWNSIKDSYVSISLSSQAYTFFERVQILSSTSR